MNFSGLFAALADLGFEIGEDHGWCKKLKYKGKPVDMFDPEDDGDYPEKAEPDPDWAMEMAREDRELFGEFA